MAKPSTTDSNEDGQQGRATRADANDLETTSSDGRESQHGHSVSQWIEGLKDQDVPALNRLWDRYFSELVTHCRAKMKQKGPLAGADEEDIALSAFHSLFRGLEDGRLQSIIDRDDFWRVLVTIAHRKHFDRRKKDRAIKRGGGKEKPEADFATPGSDKPIRIENILSHELTPTYLSSIAEEVQQLTALLNEKERKIFEMRTGGYSTEEIAAELNCATRTVERKSQIIRDRWLSLVIEQD